MQSGSKTLHAIVWTILSGVVVLVAVLFVNSRGRASGLPVYGQVQPFALTNQSGKIVTLNDLKGKVWVADVIFTRCAGPCPKMTEEMRKLQAAFEPGESLRFVTLTTDPEYDTSAVLRRYSEKFNADPERWFFLTGPKGEILANLAIGSLKLSALEKAEEQQQNENDLFIHSTQFVLVDKSGKLRGVYDSLEPGFQEEIQADIKGLLGEGQ